MRKNAETLFLLTCLIIFLFATYTCKKLEKLMMVSTGEVSNIETNYAEASGLVVDLGEGAIQHGHCYGTSPNVSTAGNKTQLGAPPSDRFTSQLTNLTAGTKYYIKAYIGNGAETVYGKELSFMTQAATVPVVTTAAITDITITTATIGGNITDDGGASVTDRGVCWNTATGPTTDNSKTNDGSGTGSFVSSIPSLTPGTTYYVRAYAINSAGTAYGNEISFTTPLTLPTLTTVAITEISENSASSGGNIIHGGGTPVTARGVCWSTSASPAVTGNHTSDGEGGGFYTSQITGLTANTEYYVRAYATNSVGTAYGDELSFTTMAAAIGLPTISTAAVTGITSTTASGGGNITNDGGSAVTISGVCWGTSPYPTISGNKTTDGTTTGSFATTLTGLTGNTGYYVRAYATNSVGTAYGDDVTFTTAPAVIPGISTEPITSVTSKSAVSGGNIISNGGSAITSSGLCWNTGGGPIIDNDKTEDGSAAGSFVSTISGLTANTYYYVKAYATNNVGTAYGNEVSFKTSAGLPSVYTTAVEVPTITSSSAQSGGNVLNDGGATVTARGVCWNTTTGPTVFNSKTEDGTGEGGYSSQLTGLTPNTKYFIRAYATNSYGVAYGNEVAFITNASASTVPDAPTIGTAIKGDALATVTFTAPVSDGGSAITGYTVTSNPEGHTGTGSVSPITVTGLVNGTAYTFTITATNANGISAASAASNSVIPSTVPDAPTIGTATKGDAQATVTFSIPADDGGSSITGYTVTSNPNGHTGTGSVSPVTVTGLANGTAYTFTVVATNANGNSAQSAASNSVIPSTSTTVYDIDANLYNVITIGTQTWIAENLKTTKYNDGTVIPYVTVDATWAGLTSGAYCEYDNVPANSATYGRLYNWYAVDNNAATKVVSNGGKNICPTGWHVPSDDDWTTLKNYLIANGYNYDGTTVDDKIAKSLASTTGWTSSITTGAVGNTDYPAKRNATGFTALPGGYRSNGIYYDILISGHWWSTTSGTTIGWDWGIYYDFVYLFRGDSNKESGLSVRCLKD